MQDRSCILFLNNIVFCIFVLYTLYRLITQNEYYDSQKSIFRIPIIIYSLYRQFM